MNDMALAEVLALIEVNNARHNKPELTEITEDEGMYTLAIGVAVDDEDHTIYIDTLYDGDNFFVNPINYDSIDKDENTELLTKIINKLVEKGLTTHQASFQAPIVFDYTLGQAKTAFLRSIEDDRVISIYDFVKNFGMDDVEANSIVKALTDNHKEQELLFPIIRKLTLHSLFNIPLERNLGYWNYNFKIGTISKEQFVDELLKSKSEGKNLSLF